MCLFAQRVKQLLQTQEKSRTNEKCGISYEPQGWLQENDGYDKISYYL